MILSSIFDQNNSLRVRENAPQVGDNIVLKLPKWICFPTISSREGTNQLGSLPICAEIEITGILCLLLTGTELRAATELSTQTWSNIARGQND